MDIRNIFRPFAIPVVYPGWIASTIRRALKGTDIAADQHQANGLHGIHQFRARLPNDPTIYRVIVCPADAPIFIGQCPADQHFTTPITEEERVA